MMNRVKDGARITDHEPSFKARYIGQMETFTPAGKGCTTPLVQRLWDNAQEEHLLPRVHMRITTSGIHMRSLEKKKEPEELFDIENISFCTVDAAVNDRIFAWVYRNGQQGHYVCRAVICSSTEKARSMSLVLSRAFQIAYKEWKASQIRSVRLDAMKQRSASLGALTFPAKHTRGLEGQRSKSVKNPSETDGTPFKNTGNVTNGVARAFSDPQGAEYYRKDSVDEGSQTGQDDVFTDTGHKEIGVQADGDTTHF